MAQIILILGASGQGKSTSARTLDPKSTYYINVASKPLPFKGWQAMYSAENKNYTQVSEPHVVLDYITKLGSKTNTAVAHIKDIIVDDAQYIMAFDYMAKAEVKGYDKFTAMAKSIFQILDPKLIGSLREDLFIWYMWHPETGKNSNSETYDKPKTIGKMLDEKITIEGLFTVVLMSKVYKVDDNKFYSFVTQNDGSSVAKSPEGMFKNLYIPNDLLFVKKNIENYNKGLDSLDNPSYFKQPF